MCYISRSLETVVKQVTLEYPVVLVTGARQVGKTTMLQKLMEGTERRYVTLDDLNERSLAKTDPEMFLQLHKPPVLIDEVQYAPELFTYIKIYADSHQEPGAFWLTGSQVFKLMHGRERVVRCSGCAEISAFYDCGGSTVFADAEYCRDRSRCGY